MPFSALRILKEGLTGNKNWEPHWRNPSPKSKYDVIIIGGGGHGLSTAYYLAKNFNVTDIAVIEKGWIGGGNTGRNTTIIRSNYLQESSIGIYEKSRFLYETLSQDLNYNIMFSPRVVLMLCQTEHELRAMKRTSHANRINGVDTKIGCSGGGKRNSANY